MLLAGAVAGLGAGIAMGLFMHFVLGMMSLIGGMVGFESAPVGWLVHLFNSAIFGIVFVPLANSQLVREMTNDLDGCFCLGIVHGAVLGLVTGGLLLPISMQLAGSTAVPIPLLPVPGLGANFEFALIFALAHLLYGLVLGGSYSILTGAYVEETEEPAAVART